MEIDIAEIEREFRQSWRTYDPSRYGEFLAKASTENRSELLARMLGAELEYSFQPPLDEDATTVTEVDDERVRPSLQLFVLRFPELSENSEVLIRLSVLEYALRLRYDDIPPNPDSYLPLCENAQERLSKLLRLTEEKLPPRGESYSEPAGASDSTVKETKASVSITLDPLPFNLGCFLLVRMVGRGGMGYVHAAIDLRSTAQVAVKVMRRIDPWSVYRFIEEFSWLSQLNHPNLVKLYDAFCEGDVRYFSMEMVEGKTLREWFKKFPENDDERWSRLRPVLAQAASAIHFLHEQGVIHCDIKCSNLMITSRRRAVLLDLGLAVREGNTQPLVGTLQYMAPEVLLGGTPTRASDWYSFGILLYEVMTSEYPPIQVDLSAETDEEKYKFDEVALRSSLAAFDSELAELCCGLLCTNPRDRLTGKAVLQRLGGVPPESTLIDTANSFVGRTESIAELELQYAESKRELSRLVIVHGNLGIGKSSLVSHWLDSQDRTNDLVISLRCYRQDHTPLRLLNMLVQELVQVLQKLPRTLWEHCFDHRTDDIGGAFPQVRQLLERNFPVRARPKSSSPDYLVKSKGIEQLAALMLDLSQQRHLVLVVDDAQCADTESLQVLTDLVAQSQFRGFVIFVDEDFPVTQQRAIRTGHLPSETPIIPWQCIGVAPLRTEECNRLLTKLASQSAVDITPSISKHIARRCEGNPFILQELFRSYAHYAKRDGLSDEQWLNSDSHSTVRRRFTLLPIQSENLLQYLAVAGQKISLHQLQMVSRILPHELQRTLSQLANQGWLRSRTNDLESDVEIAHDHFRRIIIDSMPTERSHRRHFRMARVLSSEVPPPWARMAEHYWSAERFREASACYLEAARTALKSSLFKDALYFLERANHEDADRLPNEQIEVLSMQADSLAGSGNSAAAAEIYQQLAAMADDPELAMLREGMAGEQLVRAGQSDSGLQRMRNVLKMLGVTRFKRTFLGQCSIQCRTLRTAITQKPTTPKAERDPLSPLEACLNRLSFPLTFLDNQLGPDLILRMLNKSEQRGNLFDQSLAIINWCILLSFAGRRWRKKAIPWIRTGRELARRSGSPAARGYAHLCMFVWNAQKGQPRQSVRHAVAAINWFQREPRNFQWEIQFLNWGVLGCFWDTCQLTKLRVATEDLRCSAIDRSDAMSQFWMNVAASHSSDLASDDLPRARRTLELASVAIFNQTFQPPRFFLWLSRVHQALYEGNPTEAHRILMQDWANLKRSYALGTNHFRWLALCQRMSCNLILIREQGRTTASVRDAKKCLRHMAKLEEPAFVAHEKAFRLLLDAALGRIAPNSQWQAVVDELHRLDQNLYGFALRWHQSLYANGDAAEQMRSEAESAFRAEGCVAPEKLLDIILPLPKT